MTTLRFLTPASRAFICLVIGAMLVGASPVFVRISEIGPIATAFHRAFLALPLLYAFLVISNAAARKKAEPRVPDRGALLGFFIAGALFAGDLAFWHLAILHTTIANATLLATLAPIWVTLGLFLFFKGRFAPRFLIGMAMAVAGGATLVADSVALRPEHLTGDVYGLITGLFFGAYLLTIGRLRGRFSTARIMFWSTLTTALFLLPVALVMEDQFFPTTLTGWAILIGLAWSAHALGQGLIAYAMAHLPTGFSSATMILEAVFAALLAWVLFSESLGVLQLAGGIAVLIGLVLARRGERVPT